MESTPSVEQQFLKKLIDIIEINLHNEQFGVNDLAAELGMSRITLYRKIKIATGKSISIFIRSYRLEKALEKLRQKSGNVNEIAYEVGFSSSTYFNKCFHDYYGISPGEVLKNESILNDNKPNKNNRSKSISRNKWIVISLFLSFFIIAALAIFLIHNFSKKSIEKSIAVLPFINDTPASDNIYMEGLREEIINKLAFIEEIKVISRTSSDTYRNSNKPIKTIARELNVNYVLEGSSQTINGKTRVRLQLIEAKTDDHLWSKPFEREVNNENIFEIQQDIAGLVIKNLKSNITSEEKALISKIETRNKTAYSFYLMGMNYYDIYLKEEQKEPLQKAKSILLKAIECDSSYARPVYRLAWVLFHEQKFGWLQSRADSIQLLVDKAIKLNPLFSEAYGFKGFLCQANPEKARKAFNMAIRTGPDNSESYHQFGNFCCNIGEYANTIKYSLKSIEVNKDPIVLDWTFINLHVALSLTENFELAAKYRNEYMVQHNNQLIYFNMQQLEALMKRNYAESIGYGLLAFQFDFTDLTTLDFLANAYLFQKDYQKAFFYYNRYFENLKRQPYQTDFTTDYDFLLSNNRHSNSLGHDIFPLLHTTYLHCMDKNKTNYNTHKKALLANLEKHSEYNTLWFQSNLTFFELGCLYASLNETEKAIENLKKLTKGKVNPVWLVNYLKDSPMLDGLRSNTDFIEILKTVELNYIKERKKAETVLIENGLNPG